MVEESNEDVFPKHIRLQEMSNNENLEEEVLKNQGSTINLSKKIKKLDKSQRFPLKVGHEQSVDTLMAEPPTVLKT